MSAAGELAFVEQRLAEGYARYQSLKEAHVNLERGIEKAKKEWDARLMEGEDIIKELEEACQKEPEESKEAVRVAVEVQKMMVVTKKRRDVGLAKASARHKRSAEALVMMERELSMLESRRRILMCNTET